MRFLEIPNDLNYSDLKYIPVARFRRRPDETLDSGVCLHENEAQQVKCWLLRLGKVLVHHV